MLTQMIIRINKDLKAQVSQLAKAEGKNASIIVRELLEEYIKNRDIGSYIDDLWNRIGKKITIHGTKPRDIERIIREVRKKGD